MTFTHIARVMLGAIAADLAVYLLGGVRALLLYFCALGMIAAFARLAWLADHKLARHHDERGDRHDR